MPKNFKNPFKHRCDECGHYAEGYCIHLEDKVYGWWTGCCACKPKTKMIQTYREIGVVSEPE